MKKYLEMFAAFFKIGAFTIGGGYAMLPLIENEVVGRKKWIEKEDYLDMIALAQSSPGPVAVNTSVFVGYKVGRCSGSNRYYIRFCFAILFNYFNNCILLLI